MNALEIGTLADLIGRIGTETLFSGMDATLRRIAPFDLSVIFGFPYDNRPMLLHDGYGSHATPTALQAYLGGAYLLDPFYTACVEGRAPGLWRMRELAPDQFFASDFYSASEVHPCVSLEPGSLVEEIGFLVPLPAGFTAAYSLMRMRGCRPFDGAEMRALRAVEPVVRETLRSHWRVLEPAPSPRDAGTANTSERLDGMMEAAFETFCDDRLTYQQRRVVQLILRGHSNVSIGQQIGVAEGTVKIHRKNVYRRLGISSQSELFGLFVHDLLRDLNADRARSGVCYPNPRRRAARARARCRAIG